MSDSKKAARDQAAFGTNISASNAKALDAKGKESAGKRGKSFEPNQVKPPNAEDEDRMRNAAKRSVEHVTETIADSYRNSSSS